MTHFPLLLVHPFLWNMLLFAFPKESSWMLGAVWQRQLTTVRTKDNHISNSSQICFITTLWVRCQSTKLGPDACLPLCLSLSVPGHAHTGMSVCVPFCPDHLPHLLLWIQWENHRPWNWQTWIQKVPFPLVLWITVCVSCSAMSDSLQPPRTVPARLLCPWNSPGKNTGVGCHSLFQGVIPTQGWNMSLLHCRQIF